ncbi:TIGR03842 family LLM class F420-dependent oxidoreductase [Actinomycetospora corticicola]|uniref:5,10-methylenetetrahydromethanopterin reductase n=1 Tax=Actinomycetospora corticicola TaxID=663602 RepID=A0A7Y9DZ61_9PSEU|nr:LLM class flavin-dependent oxidoreductase [Actinomycetospora corticicola]NYD38056.1 5,10-methylenetetrahydromethanopterin reductase [Actinomycetospora corticicola]
MRARTAPLIAMGPRLLLHGFTDADPVAMAARAREVEAAGWDGLLLADSQNLTPEVFVALTVAAGATTTLELGPAVTNLVTRHPAVLASAAATLQRVGDGRTVLGVGRGDSALLQVGLAPQPPAEFARDLARLRTYLHGGTVDERGYPARLGWLPRPDDGAVPIQVFASGPRITRVAAELGDRVTVVVGARPELVAARVATAREAGARSVGAYLVVAVEDDACRARNLVRGNVAIFAHFQRHAGDLGTADRAVVGEVTRRWEEATHGVAASAQADALTDSYIDHFAVVGSAAEVTDRLRGLVALGLDHLVLIGASRDVPPEVAREQERRILTAARAAADGA